MNDKIKYFLIKLISITFAIIIIISVFYNLFLAERLENIDKMLSLTKELWLYMRTRKKFWLLPIFFSLLLLGALIVLTEGTVLAPFLYPLF